MPALRPESPGVLHASCGFGAKQNWLEQWHTPRWRLASGANSNSFLFASLGEGPHGHPLTVISALAQSGVDPWLEAVGLARLSRELAIGAAFPAHRGPAKLARVKSSHGFIAEELVALLPRTDRIAPDSRATPTPPPTAAIMSANARFGLAASVLAFLIAIALLFSTHTLPGAGQGGPSVTADDKDPARSKPGLSDHRP